MKVMERARIFVGIAAIAILTGIGCHKGVQAASQDGTQSTTQAQDQGPDPADQNMAPVNEAQQQAQQYGQNGTGGSQQGAAPIVRQAPSAGQSNQSYTQNAPGYDPNTQDYDPSADAAQSADAGQPVLEADQAPPQFARIRPARGSGTRLFMDTGLLGLGSGRILLGAGRMVCRTVSRGALDAGVLVLQQRTLSLPLWVLGAVHRLLRRYQLRLRILRDRLSRRLLEWAALLLQHRRHPRECDARDLCLPSASGWDFRTEPCCL